MRILLLLALFSINTSLYGQDKSLLFENREFVWCGLDYSKVKCVGEGEFLEFYADSTNYFKQWNDLMFEESSKYDFKKAYDKDFQVNDLSISSHRNSNINVNQLQVTSGKKLTKSELEDIVADYDLTDHQNGLGLVYIFEELNKNHRYAILHTVFFDLNTKEIIWALRFKAESSGLGFRNYWANPIYKVLNTSRYEYKYAKKKYKRAVKKQK